jgi:hypothetical protein
MAKRSFAANRPNIVLNAVTVDMFSTLNGFRYDASLINDSMTGATNFTGSCDIFLEDRLQEADAVPIKPVDFGGTDIKTVCDGQIGRSTYQRLQAGGHLDIYVHATYEGPAGSYKYCTKMRFDVPHLAFANQGRCDLSKPFPQ